MFWHLYKFRLKVLFKNKYLLFWQGIFPIILGTFFYMAFSDISEMTEKLDTINVVVTAEEGSAVSTETMLESDIAFGTFLKEMEEREQFKVTYKYYDEAIESINGEEADGVIVLKPTNEGVKLSLVFSGSGMNETIIKNIINTYERGAIVIKDAMKNDPAVIETVMNELYSEVSVNRELNTSAKNMDTYNQYYFALFGMACMFGATFGMFNTEHCQADQSTVAVRRATSPTKKMMLVLSEYIAGVTVVMLMFGILVVYLTLALGIDLGDRFDLIFIAGAISSLFGVALGYFFGIFIKGKQSAKESIMTAVILFLNFLSGLMMGNMKFIIEEACPIVNRINPAAIISDCFYSICAFDDMSMYIRCIVSMIIWTLVLCMTTISILRREKYANL